MAQRGTARLGITWPGSAQPGPAQLGTGRLLAWPALPGTGAMVWELWPRHRPCSPPCPPGWHCRAEVKLTRAGGHHCRGGRDAVSAAGRIRAGRPRSSISSAFQSQPVFPPDGRARRVSLPAIRGCALALESCGSRRGADNSSYPCAAKSCPVATTPHAAARPGSALVDQQQRAVRLRRAGTKSRIFRQKKRVKPSGIF